MIITTAKGKSFDTDRDLSAPAGITQAPYRKAMP